MQSLLRLAPTLCLLVFSFPCCHAAPVTTNQTGCQLTIELRDGSRVNGRPLKDTIGCHSALLGDIILAWTAIRSINNAADTARLTTTNGDVLTVTLTTGILRVDTSFGRTDLPVKMMRNIQVSAMTGAGQMPSGLVSFWSGEDNARDSFGGNNGTVTGSATFGPGKIGQGFVFDGRNGSGVTLGNPASLQLQNFTIEMWIKRGSDRVVSYGSGGVGTFFGYGWDGYCFYMEPDGKLNFDRLGDVEPQRGPVITDTNFHHVAVTKDGSEVVFYLDGTAYPFQNYQGIFAFQTSVGFGCRPDNQDNSFLGTLDEIGVFNRALSASEIEAIYTSRK